MRPDAKSDCPKVVELSKLLTAILNSFYIKVLSMERDLGRAWVSATQTIITWEALFCL